MRFILASASPRRKELLEQIGVKFDILPATGEEVITKELPGEEVMELAKQKAEEVAKTAGADALVLGADPAASDASPSCAPRKAVQGEPGSLDSPMSSNCWASLSSFQTEGHL